MCFRCGEKYHLGHVCTNKFLNILQATEDIAEVYDEGCLQEGPSDRTAIGKEEIESGIIPDEEDPQEIGVLVHALSGEKP